jgi:phage shock protein PspC (stress-responsive transcriptional regulator)
MNGQNSGLLSVYKIKIDGSRLLKSTQMNDGPLRLGDGYIGGVCAGLAEWSGIPAILWRIAFLFVFPYAFWIYLILWVFLPR